MGSRVLVVEDEFPISGSAVEAMLKKEGHQSIRAGTGDEVSAAGRREGARPGPARSG